jgi:integrase
MENLGHKSHMTAQPERAIVLPEANSSLPLKGDFERVARRRFQNPTPFREGKWWWIRIWKDEFRDGKSQRILKRWKVAPAKTSAREVQKIASEMLRPMNQGLESVGSATPFGTYIDTIYRPTVLPLLASSTRSNYDGILRKRLVPLFGDFALRDLNTITLQKYFSGLKASHSSAMKIKDALSSVLGSAVRFQMLVRNPIEGVQIPVPRTGRRTKPHLTPEQFELLVNAMAEPYATMVYVCVMSGLRVSELIGLKWNDVLPDALVIDERFCRGDWGCPKTVGSGATIGVDPQVITRIFQLKAMEVTINWGGKGATKRFKVVRSEAPGDLVFQSLRSGGPMSDHNILSRHIKPASRVLGLPWVNWQVLRRSYGTWMVEAGADPKAVQAQMRHARISTTMDIYAQFVPAAQRRAVAQMSQMIESRTGKQQEARVM